MKFSIIVVSLNPGERLISTINSILQQSYKDYEVIVKDGGSTDNSLASLPDDDRINVFSQEDKSIYDAMNQAVKYAKGEYYLFLNCGDLLYTNDVLEKINEVLKELKADIVYGDMKRSDQDSIIPFPHTITDFTCYRNVPCHQVCFYKNTMFAGEGYNTEYVVRADYEHFLRCRYEYGARIEYASVVVALYEGNGFSENRVNEIRADKEHKLITKKYLKGKCLIYAFIMIVTLQPLRKKIAESKRLSGVYQKIKGMIYGK